MAPTVVTCLAYHAIEMHHKHKDFNVNVSPEKFSRECIKDTTYDNPEEALEDELSDCYVGKVVYCAKSNLLNGQLILIKIVSFSNIINMLLLKKLLIMIIRKINMVVVLYLQLILRF